MSHPNAEAPPTGFALRCLLDQELSPEFKLADRLGVGCMVSGGLMGDNWRGCRLESAAGKNTTSDTALVLDEVPGATREDIDLEGLKTFMDRPRVDLAMPTAFESSLESRLQEPHTPAFSCFAGVAKVDSLSATDFVCVLWEFESSWSASEWVDGGLSIPSNASPAACSVADVGDF